MIPPIIYLLASAFGLGLLAAAPVGPVNMVAIHRGAVGKWSHTLACGVGSAIIDLGFFALALWGGHQVMGYLQDTRTQDILAAICFALLLPLGILFIYRAGRLDLRRILRSRQERLDSPPLHLWTDVGTGAALTIINPAAPAYWLAAAGPWLGKAKEVMGPWAIWGGLVAAGTGLLSWFIFLTILVRFAPNRLGLRFFRTVNGLCGVVLLGFAAYCAYLVAAHHWPK
jgi:threonine/homoserine/homoserine lactone efflux protein